MGGYVKVRGGGRGGERESFIRNYFITGLQGESGDNKSLGVAVL